MRQKNKCKCKNEKLEHTNEEHKYICIYEDMKIYTTLWLPVTI